MKQCKPRVHENMTRAELLEQALFLEKELHLYMRIADRLSQTAHVLSCTTITINGVTVVRAPITHQRVMDVVKANLRYKEIAVTRNVRWNGFKAKYRSKLEKDNT